LHLNLFLAVKTPRIVSDADDDGANDPDTELSFGENE
jgi:hypothetical protein